MEIRRLKLGGFKSFVDSTELRIEPGLTGIVGPNGCGKSNLLEALRWAMGESSPKSMREAPVALGRFLEAHHALMLTNKPVTELMIEFLRQTSP